MDDVATAAFTSMAAEVAPDEIDLAPSMLQAWMAGGSVRRDLYRVSSGGDLAAFGPGEMVAVMPAVLAALSAVGGVVLPMLAGGLPVTANVVSTAAGVLELRDRHGQRRGKATAPPRTAVGLEAVIPRLIDALDNALEEQGVPEDRRNGICLGVVKSLFADVHGSTALVATLTPRGST